ncbi:MAG: methyltransferase [Desulfobacterales bacterium]|nr:methyltransferase [Desulfobacterales bacterium]
MTGSQAADDFVLGIGPSTVALANMTVREKAKDILDLGAGAGYQSLRAALHGERVFATDINARALNFGRMNAQAQRRDEHRIPSGEPF